MNPIATFTLMLSSENNFRNKDNKRQFRTLLKRIRDIHQCEVKLTSTLSIEDSSSRLKSLEQISENVNSLLISEKNCLKDVMKYIDTLIEYRKNCSNQIQIMDVETIRSEAEAFRNNKQPLMQAPYPPLCGAVPIAEDQLLPRGSFVCFLNDCDYLLGIVQGFDPEEFKYIVCDADPEESKAYEFKVDVSNVMALPTSSPARRSKASMYPLNARVLALWPDEVGVWTSVFYAATVLTQPTTSPGFYNLKFDGDPNAFADVPEKFVVLAPPEFR